MMKKIFFLLLILSFTCFSSAQKFEGGVLLGLVGSQVAGDLRAGYDKAGLNTGGWVSLKIRPKSVLHMELVYVQKGSRENQNWDKGIEHTGIMRLGYVELPMLYRYLYNDRFELETGLGLNFLVHHAETFDGNVTTDSQFRSQNLCFLAGISVNINERLRINFRTDNSVFSIRKNKVSGDVWRFWSYGQFSDALILSAYYKL
ncbi:MAG: outer membrane beta-barrel protein [Bacteroidota bacterium]